MNIYYINLNLFTSSTLVFDLLENYIIWTATLALTLQLSYYIDGTNAKSDEHIRYSNPLHSERLSGENAT